MTRTANAAPPRRTRLTLLSLFLGAFTLGTAETMPVGVLTMVADSTGESIATTGSLVTAYAMSLAIGGLVLSFATARWTRRTVLLSSLTATIGANLVVAASDNFDVLMVARVVGGAAHGVFVGAALAVAIALVDPDRIGRAIAVVLTGFAASTAVGVPVGVFVSGLIGWHAAFAIVAAITTGVFGGLAVLVRQAPQAQAASVRAQARHAFGPGVLVVLALAVVIFAGQYAAFTYISPYLQQVAGVPAAGVGWYVLVFGAAAAAGSAVGGRLADWNAHATLVLGSAALPLVLGALLLVGTAPVAALVVVLAWGLLVIVVVPSVQSLVAAAAGPGRDLAGVLPASGINLGIAAGALIGGASTTAAGPTGPVVAAMLICAVAVPGAAVLWHRHRSRREPQPPVTVAAEPARELVHV